MGKVSFAILIVLGLTLTSYFGLAAWRASGGDQAEITGAIMPKTRRASGATVRHFRRSHDIGIYRRSSHALFSQRDAERVLIRWPPRDGDDEPI
jgi:hypothetical protein